MFYWSSNACGVVSPGILQLLTARTSRKFLACRLTPDMETKLLFMTSRVKPSFWHISLCFCSSAHTCLYFHICAGAFWAAKAVSGLVSETVSVDSREPVAAVRSDQIHLWGRPSVQWGAELRYLATLGYHWLVTYHLHGKRTLPEAASVKVTLIKLDNLYSVYFLQSNVAASNAKLALFYDWLFFNPEKDSIMNIGNIHTQ